MRGAGTEAARQTSQFTKQADLLEASLEVSRAGLTHFAYDLSRTGATYDVRAIGQRVGGPMMTRESLTASATMAD